MSRIPSLVLVLQTYRMIWRNAGHLLRFAAPVFLVVCALNFAYYVQFGVGEDTPEAEEFEILDSEDEVSQALPQSSDMEQLESVLADIEPVYDELFLSWSLAIFISFLFVPFIVQTYRLFLLGPLAAAGDRWLSLRREFLGVLVLLGLSTLVGEFALMSQIHLFVEVVEYVIETRNLALVAVPVLQLLLVPAYLVGIMIVVFRLVLLFPQAALGQPWNWRWSWRAFGEARDFIGFLVNFIAAIFPVYLVTWTTAVLVDGAGPADSLLWIGLEAGTDTLGSLIMLAVAHGVIANAYVLATRETVGLGAEEAPGPEASPSTA